jgi:actin-like ATPase involved in cell morphogenesis
MNSVVPNGEGKIGLDIGTSKIMTIRQSANQLRAVTEINAFLPLPYSRITENILHQNKVHYYQNNGHFFVYGNNAEKFAGLFNAETRRPMSRGLINPDEPAALTLIKVIIQGLVKKPSGKDDLVCFSVPGAPADSPNDLIYHEQLLKTYLAELGFAAKSINEGLAIVFSELEKENFTGIGISLGGGMCNACLAYLSVPVASFSITKAGDYIDQSVGSVTGESATRVKIIKEQSLDLSASPKDKIEEALHIYYDDVITTLVNTLNDSVAKASSAAHKLEQPVPVVLAGGTARPKGFRERFEKALTESNCPVPVSEVRLSANPTQATARGAFIAAVYDN